MKNLLLLLKNVFTEAYDLLSLVVNKVVDVARRVLNAVLDLLVL